MCSFYLGAWKFCCQISNYVLFIISQTFIRKDSNYLQLYYQNLSYITVTFTCALKLDDETLIGKEHAVKTKSS